MVTTFPLKKLKEILLDPESEGVAEPYYTIAGETNESISIISPGKHGHEYNKTFGHINNFPGVEVYACAYGHGVMILQRNDSEGNAKEVRVIGLRPGTLVEVPSGYGSFIANIGKTFLIMSDNSAIGAKEQTIDQIKAKKGFAYYIVEKKGEVGLEKNPNYSYHPDVIT